MNYKFLMIFGVVVFGKISAQKSSVIYEANALLRKGNDAVVSKKLSDAAICYQKSLGKNSAYYKAAQNLGNVYFEQKRYKAALGAYQQAIKLAKTTVDKVKTYEKIGDVLKLSSDYNHAAKSYEAALLKAPHNEVIREKLANVLNRLKNQQDQKKPQKDNNSKDQQKNKSKEPQKDKKSSSSKNKNQSNSTKNNNNSMGGLKLTSNQVKQLLHAMEQEEKKTFKKVNAQKIKVSASTHEKEW